MKLSSLYLFMIVLSSQSIYSQQKMKHNLSFQPRFSFVSEYGLTASKVNHQSFNRMDEITLGMYSNIGMLYKFDQKWGVGFHANISLYPLHKYGLPPLGFRIRLSQFIAEDIEWSVAPGIRIFNKPYQGIDIETTVSWNEHFGLIARYERAVSYNSFDRHDAPSIISFGAYFKGKKGLVGSSAIFPTIIGMAILSFSRSN